MSDKTITIRVPEELHRDIKIEIAKRGISLKDYILMLVQKNLDSKKE